jgi:hypothetical protein
MLTDTQIKDVIDLLTESEACDIVIRSQFSTVSDISITKYSSGNIYTYQDAVSIGVELHDLEAYLQAYAKDHHTWVLLTRVERDTTAYCSHDWVDVGFHFTKLACRYCNKDKP